MVFKGKKIFVTGGAGFIGSHLVDRLITDNEITVYDNFSSGKESLVRKHIKKANFRLVAEDLLDFQQLQKALKGQEIVFHLASNPDIAKSMKDPALDLNQGIVATFNVLEAMRLQGVKKLVYTSGSGVYGDQGLEYTAEDFGPLLPTSMYGASKLAAEGLISAFCHLYNMHAWIFRPANIVGSGQTHGVAFDFIRKLKKNPRQLEILGDGTQSKSYLLVSDLINAMLLAIEKANDVVNLFNVTSTTFIDVTMIARIVCEEMGLKDVEFVYTGDDRGWRGDVPKVRMDIKKITKLGWHPKLASDQAIRQSVRSLVGEICK